MNKTSLREIIDDILLLVRNNNISESEDLSRAQIGAWVNHYRRKLWKDKLDKIKEMEKMGYFIEDLIDDETVEVRETGPHLLETVESRDNNRSTFTKKTVDYTDEDGKVIVSGTLDNLYNNSWRSILAVHDEAGENI